MMDGKKAERTLHLRFRSSGDADDAGWQKAYMKSRLDFHGVSTEVIRTAAKDLSGKGLGHDTLVSTVETLFSSRWFDIRSVGVVMLEREVGSLGPNDLPWLIDLVRRGGCWGHNDLLGTNIIGAVVTAHPKTQRLLPRWGRDADLWVRRTALLAQERELKRGRGNFELFERIAAPMLTEREFFIRKAIGWVLRETSKLRPELSHRFMAANLDQVSGLTLREGAKYLPPKMRVSLGLPGKVAKGGKAKG
jgi:3-methyladenine DNA glycosylase AlkD